MGRSLTRLEQNRLRKRAALVGLSFRVTLGFESGHLVAVYDSGGPVTTWRGVPWSDLLGWLDRFLENPRRELLHFPPVTPISPCQAARFRHWKLRRPGARRTS